MPKAKALTPLQIEPTRGAPPREDVATGKIVGAQRVQVPEKDGRIAREISQERLELHHTIERLTDQLAASEGFRLDPSQLANALLAEQLWQHLEAHYPQALGQTNPHNAEIERLFGEQGGF